MPRRKEFPYVKVDKKTGRRQLRKPGMPLTTLPPLGSPKSEFKAAYDAALACKPLEIEIGASRTIPRSISALITIYYVSADFKQLRNSTARVYRNILERFRESYGDYNAATMKIGDVRKVIAEKDATPDAANRLLGMIAIIMEHAIKARWRDDNPALGIKRLKHHGEGFVRWPESEITAYRNFYSLGTRERLVFELAIGTAHRRGDLVRLGWRHIVNGAISVKQNKTGAEVTIPIVQELRDALDLCPRHRLTFIAQADGRPLGAASLGNEFREWVRRAGLPNKLSLHGLRKAAACRLAEAGCTPHEIQSITGHKTLSEIERYCRDAEKKRLAESASAKVTAMFGAEIGRKK